MATARKFEAKPQVLVYRAPEDKPTWMKHNIKNRHHYMAVLIWQCKDLDQYDASVQYQVDLTEEFFNTPYINQATAYDNNLGSQAAAKDMNARWEAYISRLPRIHKPVKLDWMTYLRFTAVDYEAVQKEVQAHIDATFKKFPVPESMELLNIIYYIENHAHHKHEDFDPLSVAACIAKEGEPGSNKFGDCGFSWPSRDQFDPKMMKNFIDWYQEVRQHDVMRANFPYEVGHMWLKISSVKPFDHYVMTMYEYCTNDFNLKSKTMGAAYQALNMYHSDGGLYDPWAEGNYMVLQEWFKPY